MVLADQEARQQQQHEDNVRRLRAAFERSNPYAAAIMKGLELTNALGQVPSNATVEALSNLAVAFELYKTRRVSNG